jgi:hypothetical protein
METTNLQTTTEKKLNSYWFNYYGWIPSYRDFDMDDITIEAETEDQAWEIFNKTVKFVKSAGIATVNGEKVTKE